MADVATDQPLRNVPVEGDPPRPRRRLGIRIDMTPMVDVAFLLLIFFMVTTVFRQPLAMEVNMPAPGARVQVPESNVLTVYVDEDEELYHRFAGEEATGMPWGDLRPLLEGNTAANPDLIVLVKIHPRAPYERMVDMLDLLDDAEIQRFSLVRMDEQDMELLGEPE